MSLAIIDAREWQNMFDLETGRKRSAEGLLVSSVRKVLHNNPYPGDVARGTRLNANQWVTDTALDLIGKLDPDFAVLSYAGQYFSLRHFDHSRKERENLLKGTMNQVNDFLEKSGFIPVIVSTGLLTKLKGRIDLSSLSGLAVSSNWSAMYCGIHSATKGDIKYLKGIKEIRHIVSKDEWLNLFKSRQDNLDLPGEDALMPDFLCVAQKGYAFKTMGITLREPVNVPDSNFKVPVYTPLGEVDDIRSIRELILSGLKKERKGKIALILVEGMEADYFPNGYFLCNNGEAWFCNEAADSFYLTLSTGKYQVFAYPAGYRSFDRDEEQIKFPFSGYFTKVPENTIASDQSLNSIAVGNRSMFMHMAFGVDVSIECFARNLFNQGLLAVIKDII